MARHELVEPSRQGTFQRSSNCSSERDSEEISGIWGVGDLSPTGEHHEFDVVVQGYG